jgi:hypothetical protein
LVLAVADGDIEARVPKEFLWVNNRFRQGVFVLDVDREAMGEHHAERGCDEVRGLGRGLRLHPKTLKYTLRHAASFALNWRPGRYVNEWAIIFTPSE